MYSRKKGEREGGRGKEEGEDNAGGHVRVRTILQLLETGRRNGIEKRKKKNKKKHFFFFCSLDSLVRDLQMTIFKSTRYYNK